jgi:hypothetical protein
MATHVLLVRAFAAPAIAFLTLAGNSSAAEDQPDGACMRCSPLMTDFQWLDSSKRDRDLHTVDVSVLSRVATLIDGTLDLYTGVTLMHSEGSIVQVVGDYSEGTLHRVKLPGSATGLGPTALLHATPIRRDRWALSLDARVGVVYFDRRFPPGGSHANISIQIGPVVSYRLSADDELSVAFVRAHLSNGKGIGADNPSDDAVGIGAQLRYFWK